MYGLAEFAAVRSNWLGRILWAALSTAGAVAAWSLIARSFTVPLRRTVLGDLFSALALPGLPLIAAQTLGLLLLRRLSPLDPAWVDDTKERRSDMS